jgi:nickel transport protein
MHLSRLLPAVLLANLPALLAHELNLSTTLAAPAVVLRASFAGGPAVAHAKVQVFSPASPSAEFHAGTTDARGYFSFVPDGAGAWRLVVDDQEGHRRELRVDVPESFDTAAAAASPSRWERTLAGLALIVGATGFLYGWRSRRAGGAPAGETRAERRRREAKR